MSENITRREFLRRGAAIVLGSGIVYWDVHQSIADTVWTSIRSPQLTDGMFKIADEILEKRTEQNPSYRPITDILHEGINNYEQKSGQKAFYNRESDYRDAAYYAHGLRKKLRNRLGLSNSTQLSEDLRNLAPGEARSAIVEADNRQQMEDLLASGSGFYERFKTSHPHLYQNEKVSDYTKYFSEIRQTAQKEIAAAKEYVEKQVSSSGLPVSTSLLIEYFLEQNQGNIGLSVADTYLFSKYVTRFEKDNVWIAKNIKDEFLGPNFNLMPAGKERDDMEGKWYHTLAFPNLARYFPVEVVRLGGMARQFLTFKDQGIDKTTSDLKTLTDQREVDQLLLEYTK